MEIKQVADNENEIEETTRMVLIPLEVRAIDFHGDEINAALVQTDDGESRVYVPLRPICEYLGLAWSGQFERTKRDTVLSEALSTVRITRTEVGQAYNVICLQLEMLPGWLFGIDAKRVKPELRTKIEQYRRECFKVLWQAFQDRSIINSDVTSVVSETIVELEQVREMALALARLAEQQIGLEQRVTGHDQRFERAVAAFRDLSGRLTKVEKQLAPPQFITRQQADQVFNQVRDLAQLLVEKDSNKGKVHYATIFNAIYRMFGVSSYERIRRGQFEAVMRFLDGWRKAVDAGQLDAPRQLNMFLNDDGQ